MRHNYFQVLLEQFIEHWGKPNYEYCQQHGLEFTGHYWDHEWPNCISVPDNMAMYAWQHRPGIDILFNQYSEGTHAQFGNVRVVKELASVANQLGRRRTISETFGGSGWDTRLEDMKRIGDWEYVLGVNTLNECISFVTIRGVRKGDYPQSLSYHEPWWQAYHVLAGYFTRLSVALSHGQEINRILLIEPTTTAWMYQPDAQLAQLGDRFQQLVTALSKAQVEYDIGCEDIMARHGAVDGAELIVGQCRYHTVVVPPLTENLNAETMDLLEAYLKGGGTLFCCGPPPTLVDGQPSGRGQTASEDPGWKQVELTAVPQMLLRRSTDGFAIRRTPQDKGILYHQRRQLADGHLLFLVNTSMESSSTGAILSSARGIEQWSLEAGTVSPYRFAATEHGVEARFELPPCGSLLLFLSQEPREPATPDLPKTTIIPPVGPLEIRRVAPNVLTLDYMDVTAAGETKRGLYGRKASQFVFAKHGMNRNPWFHAIQFRDEYITKRFPTTSGFEATYRFTIEEEVPKQLRVVIERPDLYRITCNGMPVSATKGGWWLDRSFGKIDVTSAARLGENAITIKASPFTLYHELEPAYLLGDFALVPADSGFVIAPEVPLELSRPSTRQGTSPSGGWNRQGHPFYAAGMSYSRSFAVPQPAGRYHVELPAWHGSVAKIIVNDEPAGFIGYRPWYCDVTNWIKPGMNRIEVVVIGTLKNTLGPHHAGAMRGFASPHLFQRAPATGPPPGAKYDTISYGLFKPFVLKHAAR